MQKKGGWTIKDSVSKYKSRWIEVVEDQVIQPDGTNGIYGVVKAKSGVAVLPIDEKGNIYLIKEFRYPLGDYSIETAGGGIDKDESPLEIAKRELKEELGIDASEWIDLGVVRPLTAYIDCPNTLFIAKNLNFGEKKLDKNEDISMMKLSLDEAYEMVKKSEITEQRTCCLILRAKLESLI